MSKYRIYELAKEFSTSSKTILDILERNSFTVKNHMSSVGDTEKDVLVRVFAPKVAETKPKVTTEKNDKNLNKPNKPVATPVATKVNPNNNGQGAPRPQHHAGNNNQNRPRPQHQNQPNVAVGNTNNAPANSNNNRPIILEETTTIIIIIIEITSKIIEIIIIETIKIATKHHKKHSHLELSRKNQKLLKLVIL